MIEFKNQNSDTVTKEEAERIYNEIATPYKYGAVVKHDGYMVDSPTVFRYKDKWYMYYVRISQDTSVSGYETHFSSSDDLINWEYQGAILKRNGDKDWDSSQVGGYAAFIDIEFGGSNEIKQINGKYYMAYLGGSGNGYEPDPLSMGLAFSDDPTDPSGFTKLCSPILTPYDADSRRFERKTLYKSNMIVDESMLTGHKYVNFYNAKDECNKERIYMAVSDDAEHWERYGSDPIIDEIDKIEGHNISGDPQVVRLGDIYVMFFFRYTKGSGAYNMFALSKDLIHWTVREGEPLIKPEYEWENVHAHKSFVLKYKNTIYHYYCAVNSNKERFIALATSNNLKE